MKTAIVCPNCDLHLPASIEYCPSCGQDFCPSCSMPIADDADKCPECGQEFNLHCPRCDEEVASSAARCQSCGLSFEAELEILDRPITPSEENDGESASRTCSVCQALGYLEDGFCRECGQAFCPKCGGNTDDDDLTCPHCKFKLYFDCPICAFELTAGTLLCPNCDALLPDHCSTCNAEVIPGDLDCHSCSKPLIIRQRKSARTVKSMDIGGLLVRIVACPGCGRDFDPAAGECPRCNLRICTQCQIVLDVDEPGCPRCGIPSEKDSAVELCAYCHRIISDENGECSYCVLVHCPECLNLIPDEARSCPACGIKFEY